MTTEQIRIATRSSPLALWQANYVAEQLRKHHVGLSVELVHVSTSGDRNTVDPLHSFGGMGAFTKEVQLAVLDGRADVAVHSLKDLPTEPTPGLTIGCVPRRAPQHDVLVFPSGREDIMDALIELGNRLATCSPEMRAKVAQEGLANPLVHLKQEAVVGTGSIRRRAQLLHHRPDLTMRDLRGNIDTRLEKLETGDYDAIVLAFAGLDRLEREVLALPLHWPMMFPAVGQGALGLEIREGDDVTVQRLAPFNDDLTFLTTSAERSLLRSLRAGCHAPVGVHSNIAANSFRMEAVVLSSDGRQQITFEKSVELTDHSPATFELAESLGQFVAENLLSQGAERLIRMETA